MRNNQRPEPIQLPVLQHDHLEQPCDIRTPGILYPKTPRSGVNFKCTSLATIQSQEDTPETERKPKRDVMIDSMERKSSYSEDFKKCRRGSRVTIKPPESVTEEAVLFPIEDEPDMRVITFRSFLVGVMHAMIGAAVGQLFIFKPVLVFLQPLFLQILCRLFGRVLALVPGPLWWNPGPFTMKETVFASIMATSARTGAFSVYMLAAEDLYFERKSSFLVSVGILFSSQMIGYGWAGFLQSILVYPAHMIFPQVLPSAALFYSVSGAGESSQQLEFFKKIFVAMSLYAIIPTYLMPALQGVSFFCLAFPQSSIITNLFGGVAPFEGLGLFELSFDWNLVGAGGPLFTPLFAQCHQIFAMLISTILFCLAYSRSWFGAGMAEGFPFLSVSLFKANGSTYPTNQIVNKDGSSNQNSIDQNGLPTYTATNVLTQVFQSLSISAAITHVMIWEWKVIRGAFKKKEHQTDVDPHRLVVEVSYADFPVWGFVVILIAAVIMALLVCSSQPGLPLYGLLLAIIFSAILTLAVGFISAISGYYLMLNGVTQMLGGLLFPGNAFGNMWFSTFCGTTVSQALNMISDFKLGQYTHMPPISVVVAQVSGTFVGVFVNYFVMKAIIGSQREALLLPNGNGIFSGTAIQNFGANAVSWGNFSQKLYTAGGKYVAVPAALGLGLFLPLPSFVAHRLWPNRKFDQINLPLLLGIVASGGLGVSAGRFSNLAVGLCSQLWARKYHSRWFQKYNYVLSAAIDGGTQIMILILAITLQGAIGLKADFPNYFLNPVTTKPRDYCYISSESPQ